MKTTVIRSRAASFAYQHILKPTFFKHDPEDVHDRMTGLGKILGRHRPTRALARWAFNYRHPALEQTILGIHFPNPIGLAAGFDKNAELVDVLPELGFGFVEVGSITGEPCAGNPKPRLWRLPASQSIVVNYGLKNDGAEVLSRRLAGRKFNIPVGISIAKTNSPATVEMAAGVADYIKAYRAFADIGRYTTINISCPNAYGGEPFTDPAKLDLLLAEINVIPTKKPVFIKLSPDLSREQLDAILAVCDRRGVDGIICSNLTKQRSNPKIKDATVPAKGGLSGKVVEDLANALIKYIYEKTNGKYVIVGCGGVFTAADAYKKITLGASLVQMITGMIYQGPQVIGEINRGLVELLAADGLTNIAQARGIDN